MPDLEEQEAHAMLEGVDGAAGLASIGGIEIGGGRATRCTAKSLQMRNGKFVLALVRLARAGGTIDAVMYWIENLCPHKLPSFAPYNRRLVTTTDLPLKSLLTI